MVILEQKPRRIELALFVLSHALRSQWRTMVCLLVVVWWSWGGASVASKSFHAHHIISIVAMVCLQVQRRWARNLPHAEVWLFVLAMGVIMNAYIRHPSLLRRTYLSLFRWFFGSSGTEIGHNQHQKIHSTSDLADKDKSHAIAASVAGSGNGSGSGSGSGAGAADSSLANSNASDDAGGDGAATRPPSSNTAAAQDTATATPERSLIEAGFPRFIDNSAAAAAAGSANGSGSSTTAGGAGGGGGRRGKVARAGSTITEERAGDADADGDD